MSDEMYQTKNRRNGKTSPEDPVDALVAQRTVSPNVLTASKTSPCVLRDPSPIDASAVVPTAAAAAAPASSNKWCCEYCTYENFPLSLKVSFHVDIRLREYYDALYRFSVPCAERSSRC